MRHKNYVQELIADLGRIHSSMPHAENQKRPCRIAYIQMSQIGHIKDEHFATNGKLGKGKLGKQRGATVGLLKAPIQATDPTRSRPTALLETDTRHREDATTVPSAI